MLKRIHFPFLLSLILPLIRITSPAKAQEVTFEGNYGVCGLVYVSGLTIVGESGQLVNLTDYCRVQRERFLQERAQQQLEEVLSPEGDLFLRTFLEIAGPDAVEFSQTVEPQEVRAYGATICPFLKNGGTLREVRQFQAEGGLPVGFDAAVNVAAINTDCPQYRSQIGR